MARRSRRRRGAPGEPWLTSPLPLDPLTPCDDDDGDLLPCFITDIDHIINHHHQRRLCAYLEAYWSFTLPERKVKEHGAELVDKAVRVLFDGQADESFGELRSPGGFATWVIDMVAELVAAGKDTAHERLLSLFSKPKRSSPPAQTGYQSDSQYRRRKGGMY